MSKTVKDRLLKYGISNGICLIFAFVYALKQNIFQLSGADVYRVLSDACFLPGIFVLFLGLLMWLSKEGAMDGVGFVLSRAVHLLIPGGGLRHETYGEYVERKRGKRTGSVVFLVITGAIFTFIGLIFSGLFMQAHGPL